MMKMPSLISLLVAAALGAAVADPAAARDLSGGGVFDLSGTTSGLEPNLAGTVIEDVIVPFAMMSDLGPVSGTVQTRVVRSTADGTLDFYWQIQNDATSAVPLTTWRIADFHIPDAPAWRGDYRVDSTGTRRPASVNIPLPLGGVVYFSFLDWEHDDVLGLMPGELSRMFFLDTTATSYAATVRQEVWNFGDGAMSPALMAFAPAAVPLPGGLLLSGTALLALAALRRRERRHSAVAASSRYCV